MSRISVAQASMSAGAALALWQLIWSAVVAAGWDKSISAFIAALSVASSNIDEPLFDPAVALCAIALAFCAGALTAAVFALVWNWLARLDSQRSAPVASENTPAALGSVTRADYS